MAVSSHQNNDETFEPSNRIVRSLIKTTHLLKATLLETRRSLTIAFVAATLFLSSASLHTPPSHASSSSSLSSSSPTIQLVSAVTTTRRTPSNADKIILRYVEKHMFDDEHFDAFESAYREAHADTLSDTNPVADTFNSVIAGGDDAVASTMMKKFNPFTIIKRGLNLVVDGTVSFLSSTFNLDPKSVRAFVAVTTLMAMPAALGYFLLSLGGTFRKILIGQENRRYGGVTDLTAIEKLEDDIVEADEDDDDDDDEGDDDDDEQ